MKTLTSKYNAIVAHLIFLFIFINSALFFYRKFQNVEEREKKIYKIVHERDSDIESQKAKIDELKKKVEE